MTQSTRKDISIHQRYLAPMLVWLTAAIGMPMAVQAQEVTLKVHHFAPSTSFIQVRLLEPWCEKLAKESKDRIKCRIYPLMQLGGTPAQLIDQARDGIADIIYTNPAYQPGPFVKTEVFTLPFMVKDSVAGSRAMWDYVQQNALDEYQKTRPLMAFLGDHVALHFARKGAPSLEEVKGRKVRAPGRFEAKILTSLGMVPVQLPAPQVTESLSKGVIDGVLVPWAGYQLMRLNEVTGYHTDFAPNQQGMNHPILIITMNQAKYDSLPPDLKKAIDNVSGREMSAWAGQVLIDTMTAGYKAGREAGAIISQLSDAEHARWVKATAGVTDDWIAEVNAKGGDGKKLLESAKTLIKQYEK